MEWKLEKYSRIRVKTEEATLWENIMNTLSKDFFWTKRHHSFKIKSRKTNRERRAPSCSYSRFKSRIVNNLNSDGFPVASSPVTTRWQHTPISEYDPICQKLPLDSPPDGTSQSHSHVGDPETSSLQGHVTPAEVEETDLACNDVSPVSALYEGNNVQHQECFLKDCGGADAESQRNACCSGLQPFTVLERAPSMHCSYSEPQLRMAIPGLQNDYYLNLLDWGGQGLVALALGSTVALWSGETQALQGCLHLNSHTPTCSVCSVSWSNDGRTLAVGTHDGEIQLWDVERRGRVRSMQGHLSQVRALSWNQHLLSSGSLLGLLHHHDMRVSRALVGAARLQKSICGLEWSPSGHRLASGTTDGLLCIWPSDPGTTGNQRSISTLSHPTAVKALGWCPWESEVVAVGGGRNDGMLRIWDTKTETCLQSTPTNSQICSLLWSVEKKELFTAHGLPHHHIISWSYPSLTKRTQLQGHTGRVLHMALSPCESWIISGGSDQQACLWSSQQKEDAVMLESPEVSSPRLDGS